MHQHIPTHTVAERIDVLAYDLGLADADERPSEVVQQQVIDCALSLLMRAVWHRQCGRRLMVVDGVKASGFHVPVRAV